MVAGRGPIYSCLEETLLWSAKAAFRDFTIQIVKRSDTAKGFEILPRRWVVDAASLGNVALFSGLGNHVGLRGLLGGAEGIRTFGPRGAGIRVLDGAAASGSKDLGAEAAAGSGPRTALLPSAYARPAPRRSRRSR
jgi:hypothetical protein